MPEHPALRRTLTLLADVYRRLGRRGRVHRRRARKRLLREEARGAGARGERSSGRVVDSVL